MANRNNLYKLDMLILSILAKHDCYGYQLTQIMKRASGGIIKSQVSSLYPILYRMINEGYITNYETTIKQNRRRVYYHLEPEGFHQLDQINFRLFRGCVSKRRKGQTMKPHNHTDYQKRFFKEVKKQFPFYGKREKEYLKQFQTEIDAYLEEFPDSSYEAMLEAIGTPKDVVENYFQNVEDRYQLSHMKKSNYIRIGIITIIGIFLIFTIYQGVLVYKSYLDSKDTLIIHESTEIFEDSAPYGGNETK